MNLKGNVKSKDKKKRMIIASICVVIVAAVAITLGIIIPFLLHDDSDKLPEIEPKLSIEKWYNSNKEFLSLAGYNTYVVKNKTEIAQYLKENGISEYADGVSALLGLGGLFSAIEYENKAQADNFQANYTEIIKDKNLVLLSNNHRMAELYYADIVEEDCGIVAKLSDNFNILLKAQSNTLTNINSIGYRAFSGASYSEIKVDSKLTVIDNQAFFANSYIEKLIFLQENNLETIGNMAFANCGKLKEIIAPKVKTIGDFAFNECNGLETLKLLSLDKIGKGALCGTNILNGLEQLSGQYVYKDSIIYSSDEKVLIKNFSQLTAISILESVEKIAYGAFDKCVKLQSVQLNNVKIVDDKGFANCINLNFVQLNKAIYFGEESFINTKIDDITFSESIKEIGANAFRMTKIQQVTFPKSIETIGDGAFKEISPLRKIVFESEKPCYIGDEVFNNIYRIYVSQESDYKSKWQDYSDNIYSIAGIKGDFSYREVYGGLELVQYLGLSDKATIPQTVDGQAVVSIGDYSFYQLHHLVELSAENSNVISIGNSAFDGCSNLKIVALPYKLTTIGNNAFRSSPKLETVRASNNLTKIGMYAFDSTKWLNMQGDFAILGNVLYKYKGNSDYVTTPSVKYIGNRAFAQNKIVKNVIVTEGTLGLDDNAFYYCENLLNVALPNSLKTLASQVFVGCSKILEFTLPENVEYIGYGAFMKNNFATLTVLGDEPCNIALDVLIYPQNKDFKIKVKASALCNSTNSVCTHIGGAKKCYKHAPKWTDSKNKMEAIA